MTTTAPKPPARRWPWIVAVVVIAVAIIAYLTTPAPREQEPSTPTPSLTATAPAPAETPALTPNPVADAAPTGCLGGAGRDADMVLSTVEKAPHTSNGAVEIAASFMRWIHQFPVPSADDAQRVQDLAIDTVDGTDAVTAFASSPNLSGGAAADGQTFYVSTAPGVFTLDSFTPETAIVTIGTGMVIDGVLGSISRQSKTFELRWANEHWNLVDAEVTKQPGELFTVGTPFTGGC